jgi:hypothetical protein
MTAASIAAAVHGLASGECRWIGREDIHVYCHSPMVERLMPTGRMGWQPGPASYCVVCPDAGLEYIEDYDQWVTAREAVRLIESALVMEAAA